MKKRREEFERNLGEVRVEGEINKKREEIARKIKAALEKGAERQEGKEELVGQRM